MKNAFKLLFFFGVVCGMIFSIQWCLTTEYRGFIYYFVGIPAAVFLFAGEAVIMSTLTKLYPNDSTNKKAPKLLSLRKLCIQGF